MTSLVPVVGTTIENASLKSNPKCKTILASAEDDEKEQMRRRKKIRNLIMRDHGYLVSKEGGGRIVIRLSLSRSGGAGCCTKYYW